MITLNELLDLLQQDLRREYKHMLFYLNASVLIQGPHREELGEFFEKEAADEMGHVKEFAKVLVEFDRLPEFEPLESGDFVRPDLRDAKRILEHVYEMEMEVVRNYTTRREQAEHVGGVDGTWLMIFLEDQIMDSRHTASHVRQMLKGM